MKEGRGRGGRGVKKETFITEFNEGGEGFGKIIRVLL